MPKYTLYRHKMLFRMLQKYVKLYQTFRYTILDLETLTGMSTAA